MDNYVIQKLYEKAQSCGSDVVRWSDLLACFPEYRESDTADYSTPNPVRFNDLPEFDDDAAAATGGLTGGEEYKTSTGERRIKLPEILP
jgi:hypothetical protein